MKPLFSRLPLCFDLVAAILFWIILTVLSVALWGLADMISKKGTELEDSYSHVRFVICTGIAMILIDKSGC